MGWNSKYALLLFFITILTYLGARVMGHMQSDSGGYSQKKCKLCLILVLVICFGILFYFKYFTWFYDNFMWVMAWRGLPYTERTFDIMLPVGISFFVFQAAGYVIDVYRGNICYETDFIRYALFVSFFPQLVAGPIERSKNLLQQLKVTHRFEYGCVRKGLLLMLWGFFLKVVIADRCALLVDTVFGGLALYTGLPLLLAMILFGVQIYCDFLGYSIIAQGAALVLGYHIMDNFARPYFAVTIKDFWRRWHISLSAWLKDYVYIPLGGSHCSKARKYFNLLVTFFVSGLWHGAAWTYVFWGLLHGFYQVGSELVSKPVRKITERMCIEKGRFSFKLFQMLRTFVITDIAWVFFRADTFGDAFYMLKNCWKLKNIGYLLTDSIFGFGLNRLNFTVLMAALLILVIHSVIAESGRDVIDELSRQGFFLRYMVYWILLVMILFSLNLTGQEFIYFQF